ncbi:MAG: hypothetical protein LBP63_03585 [Prevotellaceae bacterium]|nr:hypothetical protein [Prevotellaceae bacterium]
MICLVASAIALSGVAQAQSKENKGKILVPFCTSGSSGIGSSDADLHSLAAQAMWKQGRRFGGNESKENVTNWVKSLDLKPAQSNNN